ncbi:MAG: DUF106 domain-containing protein [Candidatus Aenigmarchaeota archaeon]|nr:DUF106 domain-containing protein [Candidatus Aenigmarchaeota archaeon]
MAYFSPIIDVFIFSFFVIMVINIFYKLLLDQHQVKQSRERMKEMNEKIKEEQKKGNTEKVNKLLGELMSENGKIMRMSLKPMVVSFIIVILALPWIAGIYGDREVKLNDGKGELNIDGSVYQVQKTEGGVEISGYGNIETPKNGVALNGYKWNIAMNGNEVKFSRIIAYLPFALPFVGSDLGWLGWYFLSALLFMVVTRKLLKVYV